MRSEGHRRLGGPLGAAWRKAMIALCELLVGLGGTKKGSVASATTPPAGPLVGVQNDVNARAKSNKAKG